MAQDPGVKRLYSRRRFLEKVPLAGAGAFLATVLGGGLPSFRLRRKVSPPVFPKGSIFTRAKQSGDRL